MNGAPLLRGVEAMIATSFGDSHCPVCRAALWAPESETIGSRKCPRCGAELYVLVGSDRPRFFLRRPDQSPYGFLAALAAPLYGVSAEEMETMLRGADALDLVEFVIEVEEAMKGGGRRAGVEP
jgi:hypothetical protein